MTIELTLEALLRYEQSLSDEERRAVREGLDEETLAVFDLLRKPDLSAVEIKRIKDVSVELLERLKTEKLKVDHWREKESTRDAVWTAIRDFLWDEDTGLPVDAYSEEDVEHRADDVFRHIYRAYPTVPSPYFNAPSSL